MVSIENENASKGVLIGSHVHGSNIGKNIATELVRDELQKAKDNPDKPVRMVLGDLSNQLASGPSVAAEHFMTSSNTLRRKINRDRQNMFSGVPLPATPEEFLNVPNEYAQVNGQPFLQHTEMVDEKPMLIFFSENGLSRLENSSVWHCDGTFSCVPEAFAQMYVVFGSKEEHVFPVVYAFLPAKNASVFERLFTFLLSKVQRGPQKIVLDFELAAINTIEELIPDTAVEGCLFHWKKAIFSQVQKKGLLRLYNQDENMQSALQLIYSLAYVPAEQIVDVYTQKVRTQIMQFATDWNQEDTDNLKRFLQYIEKYFVGESCTRKSRRPPFFSHSLWNKHQQTMEQAVTTNNAVEGWNCNWNATCTKRPNWWKYLAHLQTEEGLSRMRWREVVDGSYTDPNPGRTSRKRAKQEHIRTSLQAYLDDGDFNSLMVSILYKI